MEGASTTAMADFITTMTSFVTGLMSWMNEFLKFVTGNPVLMVFLLVALSGTVIGIVRRWLPGRA